MQIAHLILCHNDPAQLERLIRKLAHKNASFYIHLDNKALIDPFLFLQELPNVFFIKKRVRVNWGGYSMVQATVNGLEYILNSGRSADYINLLSGQDYPLKSTQGIHDFFEAHPGKAFMHSLSVLNDWQEAIPRITRYYLADYSFPGRYKMERLINTLMPQRKWPAKLVAMGRSQWFALSRQCAAHIVATLETDPWYASFFKLSWAPDEMIFQTILYNSDFRKVMVNDNLRYVDWSAGNPNPKVLTMDDAPKLVDSEKMFARKFNPAIDRDILDYLDKITT